MLQTTKLKVKPDYIAPDTSEIYLLASLKTGGVCICQLPVGQTSTAVRHKTVEEIWYFLSGTGKVWRKLNEDEVITDAYEGIAITIPNGCHSQFQNTGEEPLKFVIITMPPWPGSNEAIMVKGNW